MDLLQKVTFLVTISVRKFQKESEIDKIQCTGEKDIAVRLPKKLVQK